MLITETVEHALDSWVNYTRFLEEARQTLLGLRIQGELRSVDRTDGHMILFGDVHGDDKAVRQVQDVVEEMDRDTGLCLSSLGDIVAASGLKQLEALAFFLVALMKYPDRVFIVKGNCEVERMILSAEGLPLQVYDKWGTVAFEQCVDRIMAVTALLPTWLSFTKMRMLVVHGGPIRPMEGLSSLELPIPRLDLWGDLDPDLSGLLTPIGPRGVDYCRKFGPARVARLLRVTGHNVLVRGHQSKLLKVAGSGVRMDCDQTMATLHSCHKAPDRQYFEADLGVVIRELKAAHFVKFPR